MFYAVNLQSIKQTVKMRVSWLSCSSGFSFSRSLDHWFTSFSSSAQVFVLYCLPSLQFSDFRSEKCGIADTWRFLRLFMTNWNDHMKSLKPRMSFANFYKFEFSLSWLCADHDSLLSLKSLMSLAIRKASSCNWLSMAKFQLLIKL